MKSNKRLSRDASDHLEIMHAIYIDACMKCIADVSDLRDLKTIRSRVEDEGVSFLTITLPNFAKDFERSLAMGFIDPTFFHGFRKNGSIPAFLQGMIGLVFDRETGRIYDEGFNPLNLDLTFGSVYVDCIRQICLAFKKIELECTPQRVTQALSSYIAIEHAFNEFSLPREDLDFYRHVSSVLWDNIISGIRLDMLVPRHGPGATAEHVSGNRKYVWGNWHERLEPYFPLVDSAYNISAMGSKELEIVTLVSQEHEQPVRVVHVPKTLKAPRIIAIEPCCMQYTQQAIRDVIYDVLESSKITSGHINFRDQKINQDKALMSSKSGHLATIDLSEASDRVPRSLALEMFRSNPDLRDAIDACRSTSACLPDGTIISPLQKFASMGSALCFPIEAMYFYTICVMAILDAQNLPATPRNAFEASRGVYVYGDDIIVPTTYAITVLDYLQKYNCKINTAKTFLTGKFRESCGVDAYDGEPVTPVYLRQLRPKNRQQARSLISWVATGNLFYKKGYWRTAQLMWNTCERILGSLPYLPENSGGLGRYSYLGYRSVSRWNVEYQRLEVKSWVPRPVYRTDRLEGYAALQKSFLKAYGYINHELTDYPGVNQVISVDESHLERSALHGAVALTRRWVPSTM
jgi:hypothetical protein